MPLTLGLVCGLGILVLTWAAGLLLHRRMATTLGLWVATVFAAWVLQNAGVRWLDLGLAWPQHWPWWGMPTAVLGLWLTTMAVLAAFVVGVATPLNWPPADFTRFTRHMKDNPRYLAGMLALNWTSAAFVEEMLFRGFFIGAGLIAFGDTPAISAALVFSQAVVFGVGHTYQGKRGMVQTGLLGFVFGVAYLVLDTLWPLIFVHGIIGTVGLLAMYAGENRRKTNGPP